MKEQEVFLHILELIELWNSIYFQVKLNYFVLKPQDCELLAIQDVSKYSGSRYTPEPPSLSNLLAVSDKVHSAVEALQLLTGFFILYMIYSL